MRQIFTRIAVLTATAGAGVLAFNQYQCVFGDKECDSKVIEKNFQNSPQNKGIKTETEQSKNLEISDENLSPIIPIEDPSSSEKINQKSEAIITDEALEKEAQVESVQKKSFWKRIFGSDKPKEVEKPTNEEDMVSVENPTKIEDIPNVQQPKGSIDLQSPDFQSESDFIEQNIDSFLPKAGY